MGHPDPLRHRHHRRPGRGGAGCGHAPAAAQARARLRGLAHALASATALYAGRNWLARRRLRHPAAQIAARRFRRGDLLSVPELAAIARLPADPPCPAWPGPGPAPSPRRPPSPCPARTPGRSASPTPGSPRPVGIAVADARHHLRIIGATGTGKTTLITGQILADAERGPRRGVHRPQGRRGHRPARPPPRRRRRARWCCSTPPTGRAPPCLNVLQGDGTGTDTDVITDNVTGIFRRIFAAFWGPRTDDIFRAACLTLLQLRPARLRAGHPRRHPRPAHRRRLPAAGHRRDPRPGAGRVLGLVRAAVRRQPRARDRAADEQAPRVPAPPVRPPGDRRRPVHLHHDRRSSTTAGCAWPGCPRASSARKPPSSSARSSSPRPGRPPPAAPASPSTSGADAGLYIDECQNFLNLPYPLEDMLAEARAYRLSITMAHQNLAQLPADLRAGISANARSQVIFTASPEDARDLERHTLPEPGRPRPVPPRRLPGRRPARRRRRRDPRVHPAHPAAAPAVPGRARLIRRAARAAYSGSAARTAAPAGPRGGSDPRLPPAA